MVKTASQNHENTPVDPNAAAQQELLAGRELTDEGLYQLAMALGELVDKRSGVIVSGSSSVPDEGGFVGRSDPTYSVKNMYDQTTGVPIEGQSAERRKVGVTVGKSSLGAVYWLGSEPGKKSQSGIPLTSDRYTDVTFKKDDKGKVTLVVEQHDIRGIGGEEKVEKASTKGSRLEQRRARKAARKVIRGAYKELGLLE